MTVNKNKRAFAAGLLIALILPLVMGCEAPLPVVGAEEGLYINGERVDISVPESGSYFYKQLTDEEKIIYSASVTALESGACEYELAGVDCDKYGAACKRAVEALLRDRPEYFWIDGGYQIRTTKTAGQSEGALQIMLTTHAYWQGRDLSSARKALEDAAAELIAEANKLSEPYDKVKFVNDWLADNVEYDDYSFLNPSEMTDDDNAFVNTVYGTLVERKTLCGGYAYTFSYMMNRLGIEALYVTGTTVDGLHAWNAVKLGGEYYYIDVTWADDNQNDSIIYSYFCLNDEEMSRTHTLDALFNYPVASASEYNYYRREGLYLETYSFNKYSSLFSDHPFERAFSVKFPNEVVLKAAVSDIIENSKFYKLEGMDKAGSFSYIVDDVHYILTLYP